MNTVTNIRIHYILHVPFEGPGYIHSWALERGGDETYTKMYEQYQFPDIFSIDMLVIMGGPMGVYEEDIYPWLKDEKAFVRSAIAAGKKVVGICLGPQIIADVLNANVYPNKVKEIGWMTVKLVGEKSVNLFSSKTNDPIVFQWHGDTFDLPDEAELLATSDVCRNQAFLYKDKVLALQFHFEVTEDSCQSMVDNGRHELVDAPYIQTEDFIKSNMQHIKECNNMIKSALDKLFI